MRAHEFGSRAGFVNFAKPLSIPYEDANLLECARKKLTNKLKHFKQLQTMTNKFRQKKERTSVELQLGHSLRLGFITRSLSTKARIQWLSRLHFAILFSNVSLRAHQWLNLLAVFALHTVQSVFSQSSLNFSPSLRSTSCFSTFPSPKSRVVSVWTMNIAANILLLIANLSWDIADDFSHSSALPLL